MYGWVLHFGGHRVYFAPQRDQQAACMCLHTYTIASNETITYTCKELEVAINQELSVTDRHIDLVCAW